jgi:antitoxin component of RelBE/YafQ-DinJ toxin-antitoxin module
MAKLQTKKVKYGVSVAARIDTQLAARIAEKAEKLGISYAQMIGLLIAKGFSPEEPITVENTSEIDAIELKTYITCPS